MTINFESAGSQKKQVRALLALVASIMAIGTAAQAQSGSENAASFGTLGQQNSAITGYTNNTACVPVSIADGLTYLNNVFPGALPGGNATYTTVNNLQTAMGTTAAGTSYGSEVTGLQNYLAASAPKIAITGGQYVSSLVGGGVPASLSSVVQNTIPTASFLANGLNTQQAVTMWIQFGNIDGSTFVPVPGVHSVTLTSINVGTGKISFMDPWGGAPGATSAINETFDLMTLNGYLTLYSLASVPVGTEPIGSSLPSGEGSTFPLLADGNLIYSGRIIADLEEAVVPEPATYFAGALLLLPFGISFFRKSRGFQKMVD